jgi:hypothetical protein
MLEREHINWYWEDILRAQRQALSEIEKAVSTAKASLCGSCGYCRNTTKHKQILEQTTGELLALITTLNPGDRTSCVFAKTMTHELAIYRGFITDTGEYVPIHNKMDHSEYRKRYSLEHGEERAYRMINIHGGATKTKVLFCDRKSAPNALQYAMLRQLMIDAQGQLSFHFQFDTNHPRH